MRYILKINILGYTVSGNICRYLRLLGLSYLAPSVKSLTEKSKALRIISAIDDKICSRYSENQAARRARLVSTVMYGIACSTLRWQCFIGRELLIYDYYLLERDLYKNIPSLAKKLLRGTVCIKEEWYRWEQMSQTDCNCSTETLKWGVMYGKIIREIF